MSPILFSLRASEVSPQETSSRRASTEQTSQGCEGDAVVRNEEDLLSIASCTHGIAVNPVIWLRYWYAATRNVHELCWRLVVGATSLLYKPSDTYVQV